MADEQNPLDAALAELAVSGTGHDRKQLTALRDRLAAGRLRVVVAGESQRAEHGHERGGGHVRRAEQGYVLA